MMIRRRSLLSSSCSCVSVFVVALAIVCTSTHLSTVQAFSSPSSNTHHKSLPSTSTSTLSSFTLSQRVNRIVLPNYHSVPRTIATQYRRQHHTPISTTTCHASAAAAIVNHGITTFMSNWKSYSLIPLVAGFVGWFTNYLAVQMIFYPIKWRGLPIYKVEGEPLGLLGWQGEVFDRCVLFYFRPFDTHTSSLCPVLDGWSQRSQRRSW